MNSYAMAWIVVAVCGIGAAALAFIAVNARRFTRPLRWPLAALVLAWALVPHRFDAEHTAPALAVALFRWAFEDNADPAPAAALVAATTALVLALTLAAAAARWMWRWRSRAALHKRNDDHANKVQ